MKRLTACKAPRELVPVVAPFAPWKQARGKAPKRVDAAYQFQVR